MIINQVDQTDIGRYTCHAFNDYDKIGETTDYQLNVISKINEIFIWEKKKVNPLDICLVPPELLPIQPVEISIDDEYSSRRVSFSCRVQRGSAENLSLEWFYPNETIVQVNSRFSNQIFEWILFSFDSQSMEYRLIRLIDFLN